MEPLHPDDETGAAPTTPRGPGGIGIRGGQVRRLLRQVRFAYIAKSYLDYKRSLGLSLYLKWIPRYLEYKRNNDPLHHTFALFIHHITTPP
jgi:hypothetical protein